MKAPAEQRARVRTECDHAHSCSRDDTIDQIPSMWNLSVDLPEPED